MIIGFGLAGALLWASDFTSSREIGLLYLIEMPLWAQVVVGLLLLDLIGAYVSDVRTLTYGIDTHMDAHENDRLGNLLAIPFQKYREPVQAVEPSEPSMASSGKTIVGSKQFS